MLYEDMERYRTMKSQCFSKKYGKGGAQGGRTVNYVFIFGFQNRGWDSGVGVF